MGNKVVSFGQEARNKMIEGVHILADAVASTFGPCGRTVIIDRSFGNPKVTKDGVSVAKEIELEDRQQNLGAKTLKSVSSQTGDLAGDGTTTTTIIGRAIIDEGNKFVVAGMNPVDLKHGIDVAVKKVVEYIKANSRKIDSSAEIAQVGTISANGDRRIGEIIAEAMDRVGKNGAPITVQEGKGSMDVELTTLDGMNFDRGYISQYFVTNQERMVAELESPLVLIYDGKISTLQPMLPLLESIVRANKPLFIICDDIEGEALATLVLNNLKGTFKVLPVKAPGFGERKKAILEDIAVLTKAVVISEEVGLTLANTTMEHLGKAQRVVAKKDETTIVANAGSEEDVKARCKQIEAQLETTKSEYDKEKLQERIAKLCGRVAILTIGGGSEIEVKEKKDRVEDALHATRAAVEEGVVAGGGVTFLYAIEALNGIKLENKDQDAGVQIVRHALEAPIRIIMKNAGLDASVIVGKLLEQSSKSFGFDAAKREYVDMYKAGILDPVKVSRIAIQTAASVASMLLMNDVSITDAEDSKSSGGASAGMGGGMGGMY